MSQYQPDDGRRSVPGEPPASDRPRDEASDLYDALAHPERRAALRRIERSGSIDVRVLAGDLIDVERDGRRDWRRVRRRVTVALYHRHLPKLDDAGLVEFDPDENTVRYRERPEAERLLDWIERRSAADGEEPARNS